MEHRYRKVEDESQIEYVDAHHGQECEPEEEWVCELILVHHHLRLHHVRVCKYVCTFMCVFIRMLFYVYVCMYTYVC